MSTKSEDRTLNIYEINDVYIHYILTQVEIIVVCSIYTAEEPTFNLSYSINITHLCYTSIYITNVYAQ